MSRVGILLFATGALVLAGFFAVALRDVPDFGDSLHPYRDLSVRAARGSVSWSRR
jgi:hypothetical protein